MTISEMRNALAQEHVEHLQMMSLKGLFEYALDSISDLSDAQIEDAYRHADEVAAFNKGWHPQIAQVSVDMAHLAAERAIAYAIEKSKKRKPKPFIRPVTWKK